MFPLLISLQSAVAAVVALTVAQAVAVVPPSQEPR
jgi:hypothetical protein